MAHQSTPQQRNGSQSPAAEPPSAATGKSSKSGANSSAEQGSRARSPEQADASSGAAPGNLKDLLEELGAASEAARLQLQFLAVEARQRTGELGARLEHAERGLDRGLHQALTSARDGARQLSKALHSAFGANSPAKSPSVRVDTVMTAVVQACSVDDPLQHSAQIMWDGDYGSVPVLDAAGRVCGIITDRDICMAAYTKGLPLDSIRVADVMSGSLRSCAPSDTLERAIEIMAEAEVRRLPVVAEDGKLQGILSLADIAHGAELLGHPAAETKVFRLLAALSSPRKGVKQSQRAAE